MAISKVSITEGCIGCGVCVSMEEDIFEMSGDVATVKEGADLGANEATIREAAESCPVNVIKVEE